MKEAGILLHISSLPNKYGIGSLGKSAYDFVDFLNEAGQSIWQILPIGPTSYGDSPYSSLSSFAFNPYFIDLEILVEDGLLGKDDLPNENNSRRIDYSYLYDTRFNILYKAYLNRKPYEKEFLEFVESEKEWLDDYALYMVLKGYCNNKAWNEWYDDFKYKNLDSIAWAKNEFKDIILSHKFNQFLFYKQFQKLKSYANSKGIKIMGDMPIYCAYDSADVWANPHYFELDNKLNPINVAGCPPDQFTEDGQLWGNPLYNYELMKNDNYSWWVRRVKHSLRMFDILRIDHFRGFAGYYKIPYGDINAKNGFWVKGPGYDLFKEIEKAVPNAQIVAENLGFLTDDVFELLDECGYPGMHIFQFELGDGVKIPLKKGFKENTIIYSGTHDNQTIMTFYNELNEDYRKVVDSICKIKFTDRPNLKIIEHCMKQKSNFCIIPIQDYLGLTDEYGRMNTPSTLGGNWSYKTLQMDYSNELKDYILKITTKYNRLK